MSPDAESWIAIGTPRPGGILIVADHASNRVPADIDLDIPPAWLNEHIAIDLGVADISARIVSENNRIDAFLANVSRLVCDFNRPRANCITLASDGRDIPGNHLSRVHEEARAARFHDRYHGALAARIAAAPPALLLSLHSFTPRLATRPQETRPWEVACLYNEDDRAARIALPALAAAGYVTGDQQPYSGRVLNYTMNRHGEAGGLAYLGIEMRQDVATDPHRAPALAATIAQTALRVVERLTR